jgi:hypothetical protein
VEEDKMAMDEDMVLLQTKREASPEKLELEELERESSLYRKSIQN